MEAFQTRTRVHLQGLTLTTFNKIFLACLQQYFKTKTEMPKYVLVSKCEHRGSMETVTGMF